MVSGLSKAASALVNNICNRSISNLSVSHERKYGVIGRVLKVRNEVITFSFAGKDAKFETKRVFKEVDKAISKAINKNVNKPVSEHEKKEWFKQENVSILSAEVNKIIDATCEKYGNVINKKDKERIFNNISSGTAGIELDKNCTRGTIYCMLYGSDYLSAKIKELYIPTQSRDEKNNLSNMINSRLTDMVFTKKFGGTDLNILRMKTAEEIALLMKSKYKNKL